jgi:hypothetical protein
MQHRLLQPHTQRQLMPHSLTNVTQPAEVEKGLALLNWQLRVLP